MGWDGYMTAEAAPLYCTSFLPCPIHTFFGKGGTFAGGAWDFAILPVPSARWKGGREVGKGGEIYALTWVEATHGRYSVQTHSARLQTLPVHGTVSVIPRTPSPLTWPHLCSVGARAYSLSFF